MVSITTAEGNRTLAARALYAVPHDARRKLFSILSRRKFHALQQKRSIQTSKGYSYKPFDDQRCIFVHIPKTGGVSICANLFGNLAGGHDPITLYQLIFPSHRFYSYYKFAFVRNPWDRLFSAYCYLKNGGMSERDARWSRDNLAQFHDFNSFVEQWVTKRNVLRYVHFVPQYRFLCSPNSKSLLVNFIGLYENITEDFAHVMDQLSIDNRKELLTVNRTRGKDVDYRDVYTSTSRKIVANIYWPDIKLFGYHFDGSSLSEQLTNRNKLQLYIK